jgi:hypothetical protein
MNVGESDLISFKKKNKDWAKKKMDSIITLGNNTSPTDNFQSYINDCYRAYFGDLDMKHYQKIEKPLGDKTPDDIILPADIRNYPIIKPTIDLVYGEYAAAPKHYTVINTNADVENIRLKMRDEELRYVMEQKFVNTLNEMGIDTGVVSAQVQSIQEVYKKYDRANWKDKRAITGQTALDYIVLHQEVHNKYNKAFLIWLITGVVTSLKEPISDEVIYEILDPRQVRWDKDPNIDFIEDAEWATIRYVTSLSRVLETFYSDLTVEQVKELERISEVNSTDNLVAYPEDLRYIYQNANALEVIRVFWKSKKKVGVVRYKDPYGVIQEKDVDEDYVLDESIGDIDVQWWIINEVWEGTRIANKYYTRIRPCLVQRTSIDNPAVCKLPVNGRTYNAAYDKPISLVGLGIPLQVVYNIYKYRLEAIIAKSKGVVMSVDLNAIPEDMEMEEWLLYITELGFMIEDYKDKNLNAQRQSVLDLSFSQALKIHLELLQSIIVEWEELSGITRQRKGQTQASETLGGVERAISQSHLNTAIYADLFQQFENREYMGLLDTSKVCWIDGKQAMFYLPEFGMAFLDVDGPEHSETNYGIFTSNSKKIESKLSSFKNAAVEMITNGNIKSAVFNILDSENIPKIKALAAEAEDADKAFQQALQKQQEDALIQVEQLRKDTEEMKQDREDRRTKWKLDAEIEKATITALGLGRNQVPDADGDGEPDVVELGRLALEDKKLMIDSANKTIELELKSEDQRIKREDIASKERIAKSRPKGTSK